CIPDLFRCISNPSPLPQEKFSDFNTGIRSPPKQMVWCTRPRSRHRAVVLAWERQLMVVGNSSESIRFVLDEDSHLVPELDGVRILSRSSHEFLHEIPGGDPGTGIPCGISIPGNVQ
ncbi:vacuolar protein sorting-associated protein 16 homolog, partial [Cyanistes caeruleus]|uniref:vacuolar protein sorting-associated protein 16 homolog n=1 Tax=Cyanistes caeruleus TaxID=156563 RepID=UPI000CDB4CF0